jgi:hypothetical protein
VITLAQEFSKVSFFENFLSTTFGYKLRILSNVEMRHNSCLFLFLNMEFRQEDTEGGEGEAGAVSQVAASSPGLSTVRKELGTR